MVTPMEQRTVVITGANTGIGLETAVSLASAGDRVVIACRNAAKAEAAVGEIAARAASDDVSSVALDLGDLASVRACAEELGRICDRVDVLINNAGLIQSGRATTTDGFEMSFGVNHLGHFALTSLLGDLVKAAPTPRVINLASVAHWMAAGGLRFDDLQSERRYNVWVAYGRSKLANIYFTVELAQRWRADGVCVSAVHPGVVRSEFGQGGDTKGVTDGLIDFSKPFSITPDRGADTSVWLATAATGADLDRSGGYWVNRKPGLLAPWARRRGDATKLWTASEALLADAAW
jgi:NAD(P)-dependent dehydrogenase (short-subunit alcohol dehydrogenase family)